MSIVRPNIMRRRLTFDVRTIRMITVCPCSVCGPLRGRPRRGAARLLWNGCSWSELECRTLIGCEAGATVRACGVLLSIRFGRDRSPLIFEYVDPKVEPPLWCLSSPRPTAVAVKRRPQSVCSGRAARFSATETLTDLFLLNLGCVMPDQYGEQLCTPHAGRLGIVFDQTLHQGAVVCSDQSWSQRRSVGDHEPELVE